MLVLMGLLLALAPPFWEAKEPAHWTPPEIERLLTDSPWAQMAELNVRAGDAPRVQVYLATAKPARLAESELRRRAKVGDDPLEDEYREFLAENEGKVIVLAVRLPDPQVLADAAEMERMLALSVLRVGRRKYKAQGHFPPTSNDRYLRLVFERQVNEVDKLLSFDLYIASASSPFRLVVFPLSKMWYRGELEF